VAVEVVTKLVPLIVRTCEAVPEAAEVGESVVIVGTGLLTLRLTALEEPPPGVGFVTTTGKVPAVATWAAVSGIVI
jgi:hypothetical protein